MSRRTLAPVLLVCWAVGLGLFVALLDGRQEQISVEVWLAIGGSVLVGELAWRLVRSTGTGLNMTGTGGASQRRWMASTIRRLRHWLSEDGLAADSGADDSPVPAQLRSMAGMLELSYESERHFNRRLRPRLRTLAYHYLPQHHGVDPSDGDAVERVLGQLSWLIDSGSHGEMPTGDQVAEFLALLLGDSQIEKRERV